MWGVLIGVRARMGKPDVTIVGLGSLLSERSSRTTFPNLANFRLAGIDGYRRVCLRETPPHRTASGGCLSYTSRSNLVE